MAIPIQLRSFIVIVLSLVGLWTTLGFAQRSHGRSHPMNASGVAQRGGAVVRVSPRATIGDRVSFQVEDLPLTGQVEHRRELKVVGRNDAAVFIAGSLSRSGAGTFKLLQYRGVTVGTLNVPGRGEFQFRDSGLRGAVMQPIAHEHEQSCAANGRTALDQAPGQFDKQFAAPQGAEDGSRIDLMVLYTAAARVEAGGTTEIEAHSFFAVAVTNEAYANSLINTRLRIVHMQEIAYAETGNSVADLNALGDPADGIIDGVHAIRDAHLADVVAMLIGPSDACGVGPVMTAISPMFERFAFCVANWSCAAASLTLAHEIGHVMGCGHDRANGLAGALPFSFGYQEPTGSFRTVMATTCFSDCPRIDFFSNPAVSFQGLPTGIVSGGPTAADNAQSINLARGTVANFRDATCGPIGDSGLDCNENCIADENDIASVTSLDCNGNGIPDECDIALMDCNGNGIPDACDLATGADDCNDNGIPDECDFPSVLTEGFDALAVSFGDNWRRQNNSQPLGEFPWGPGDSLVFPAQDGFADAAYAINGFLAGAGAATLSDWLFTPEVSIENGTELSFFTRTVLGSTFPDRLEVRLSTNGGSTDVGTTAASVGDFTMLLLEINPLLTQGGYPEIWSFRSAVVTGLAMPTTGRFAFRYFVTNGGPNGANSNIIGLDTVEITAPLPDVNVNGIRDECDIARGDSDLDGFVGILDFLAVLATWGPCPPPCPEDADGDGFVGILDFLNVLANWGP